MIWVLDVYLKEILQTREACVGFREVIYFCANGYSGNLVTCSGINGTSLQERNCTVRAVCD